MFFNFVDELRSAGIPASFKEHLTLIEALDRDVIEQSPEAFYYLSRATFVKDEGLLDRFDQVFQKVFKGILSDYGQNPVDVPEDWLKAVAEKYVDHGVIHRKKMGFSIPQAQWLREDRWFPIIAAIIRRPSSLQEFIREAAVERVLSEFESGQLTHANRIWLLLWFQLWEGLFLSGIYQPQQRLSEVGQAAT